MPETVWPLLFSFLFFDVPLPLKPKLSQVRQQWQDATGGEGSILGSLIGALIMAFLRNGCQQMGWPNYIQEIIIGVIIVVAVALDRFRARWAERTAMLPSATEG